MMRKPIRRLVLPALLSLATIAAVTSWYSARLGAQNDSPLLDRLRPDVILFNGKIVTVDKNFSIVQAVAIKDGKFVAVGSNDEVKALAGKNTKVEDLGGRTVLPGFIDPHVHFAHKVSKAPDPLEDMFAEAASFEQIRRAIQLKIAKTPPGELVWFSRGASNANKLSEKRWPTAHDLDPISPNHPVLLGFASDHTTVVNSYLMKKVGINKDTPQPTTLGLVGEIQKDPETGEPTGILREKGATTLAREPFDIYNEWEMMENIPLGFDRVLKAGVTSLYDPSSNMAKALDNKPAMRAYQQLDHTGQMKVRVNNLIRLPIRARPVNEVLDFLNSLLYINFSNDYLRVGTLKISVDGSGMQVPPESVRKTLIAAHKAGWQMFIHLGPESYDIVTDSIDEAYRLYPREDARHVITHAGNPKDKNLAVLKKYHMIVEPQTCGIYTSNNTTGTSKEPGHYGRAALRTYINNGVTVMTGTDQKPIGPLYTIFNSVTRLMQNGKVLDPEERLTLEEAIRAVTITPAYGMFEENKKGSIEVGKLADLVVLGQDLMTVDPVKIKDIPVMMTMVGGKWLYINPNKDPNQPVEYIYYG